MRTLRATNLLATALLVASSSPAHELPHPEFALTNVVPLAFAVETRGPVHAPKPITLAPGQRASGQGFWKFIACPDLVPVPATIRSVTNAHGTIIVDKATDTAYWGLQGAGWIGFSNKLRASWIVAGDSAFTNGNLHGADILARRHDTPLVAAADNVAGRIYLTDVSFQHAEILERPTTGPYATNNSFRPTDVAFASEHELWAVDGYARQRFMPADVSPLRWRGEIYGGKQFSATLHGVTYDKPHDDLLFSARPEGQLKRVDRRTRRVTDIAGLPAGTLLCDVDLWGDYALAACLDGPDKTPGPIHIINLKKRAIVATIKPKEELGYADAQHIHDAAWFVTGRGREREVYIVFTFWNPGGIGTLKLVNVAE
jgi:hypothetical protein